MPAASLPLKRWRARMETEEGKAIYDRRKQIERVHAHIKNRGLVRLQVRGIENLFRAITHNMWLAYRLTRQGRPSFAAI